MNKFIEIPATKQSISKRRLVFGVGINDADYMTSIKSNGVNNYCPYYEKWTHMLERCYSDKFKKRRPSYLNVTTCSEWLLFSTFKTWMINQDWENKELDKDLKVKGNKTYSPDTCLFIPSRINALIIDRLACRGEFKLGVSWHKPTQKYRAQCRDNKGKQKYLGLHLTEELAHQAWCKFKKKIILEISEEPENIYIKQYLKEYSNSI